MENNNIKSTYDYTIIGAGLSGCILYHRLKELNYSVLLIDEEKKSTSSKVAAGLYNPIVFKRLTKSWEADLLHGELVDFYKQLEQKYDSKLLYENNIVKIIANEEEKNFWLKKANSDLKDLLDNNIFFENQEIIQNSAGLAKIKKSGFVDIKSLLNLTINLAKSNNEFINSKLEYQNIQKSNNEYPSNNNYLISLKTEKIHTQNIIFTEGFNATQNPFFPKCKFKLTKGEVLTLKISNLEIDYVLNKGVFLLPLQLIDPKYQNLYRCGATYEWDDLTETQTEKGKNEILKKLEQFIKTDYEIIEHNVGIRPTVIDRRPIIGSNGQNVYSQNVYIFNGMGTKGVMIAPYISKLFVKHFIQNQGLEDFERIILKESNYERFNV